MFGDNRNSVLTLCHLKLPVLLWAVPTASLVITGAVSTVFVTYVLMS